MSRLYDPEDTGPRPCEECEAEILQPASWSQRFCTPNCRLRHFTARQRRAERLGILVIRGH